MKIFLIYYLIADINTKFSRNQELENPILSSSLASNGIKLNSFFDLNQINAKIFDSRILYQSKYNPILIILYDVHCQVCPSLGLYLTTLFQKFKYIGLNVYTVENNYNNIELIKRLNVPRTSLSFILIIDKKIKVIRKKDIQHFLKEKNYDTDAKYVYNMPQSIQKYLKVPSDFKNIHLESSKHFKLIISILECIKHNLVEQLINSSPYIDQNQFYSTYQEDSFSLSDMMENKIVWPTNLMSFLKVNKIWLYFFVPHQTTNFTSDSLQDNYELEIKILAKTIYDMRHIMLSYKYRSFFQVVVSNIYFENNVVKNGKFGNYSRTTNKAAISAKFLEILDRCSATSNVSRKLRGSANQGEKVIKTTTPLPFDELLLVVDGIRSHLANTENSLETADIDCRQLEPTKPIEPPSTKRVSSDTYATYSLTDTFFANDTESQRSPLNYENYLSDKIFKLPVEEDLFLNWENDGYRVDVKAAIYPKLPRLCNRMIYHAITHSQLNFLNISQISDALNAPEDIGLTRSTVFSIISIVIIPTSLSSMFKNYSANRKDSTEEASIKFLSNAESFVDYFNNGQVGRRGGGWHNYTVAYMFASEQTLFLDRLARQAQMFDDNALNSFSQATYQQTKYGMPPLKISFESYLKFKLTIRRDASPSLLLLPILTLMRLPYDETRFRFDFVDILGTTDKDDFAKSFQLFHEENIPTQESPLLYDTQFPEAQSYSYFKRALKSFTESETFQFERYSKLQSTEIEDHSSAIQDVAGAKYIFETFGAFYMTILSPLTFDNTLYRRVLPSTSLINKPITTDQVLTNLHDNHGLYRYFFRTPKLIDPYQKQIDLPLETFFPYTIIAGPEYIVDEFRANLFSRAIHKVKSIFKGTAHTIFGKYKSYDNSLLDLSSPFVSGGLSNSRDPAQNLFQGGRLRTNHILKATTNRIKQLTVGRDNALTVLSVIFSFIFVLGGGYFMAYLVKLEEDKIAEENRVNPIKLPNRIVRQDMIFHELKPGTYNALVRLLKPGCRTILIFLDDSTKSRLLDQFSRILHPYRKNVSLMFGFVMISKYISWYRRLLLQVIGNTRKLNINPKNCVGTVLVVNGYRKYYCIYHARHRHLNNQTKQQQYQNTHLDEELINIPLEYISLRSPLLSCPTDMMELEDRQTIGPKSTSLRHNAQNRNFVEAGDDTWKPPYPWDEMDFIDNRNACLIKPRLSGKNINASPTGRQVKLKVNPPDTSAKQKNESFCGTSVQITPPPSYSSLCLESLSLNGPSPTNPHSNTDIDSLSLTTSDTAPLAKTNKKLEKFDQHSNLIRDQSLPAIKIQEVDNVDGLIGLKKGDENIDRNEPTNGDNPLALVPRIVFSDSIDADINLGGERCYSNNERSKLSPSLLGRRETFSPSNGSDISSFPNYNDDIETIDNLLNGFPRWLDNLFAGKVQRYYIDYWPPLKI